MNLDLPRRRRSSISLTPLIDVVFILLLFFMLASNFQDERTVALTASSQSKSNDVNEIRTISRVYLESENSLLLDGIAYGRDQLLVALTDSFINEPDLSVSIGVGEQVDVQSLLDLISQIKKTGITRVVMQKPGEL